MKYSELSEEEKVLINTFREQKKTLVIENKVNDGGSGNYDIEKITFKYENDKSVKISTSQSSYSDFDYKLGKRTGVYHITGGWGFFSTTLNIEQTTNLKKFLDKIIESKII